MIDFTHTKRPEFIQLVLIIAVVCLALGAITPAASAASYDWEFSVYPEGTPGEISGSIDLAENVLHEIPNALPDGSSVYCQRYYTAYGTSLGGSYGTLLDFITNPGIYTDFASSSVHGYLFDLYWVSVGGGLKPFELDEYVRLLADFMKYHTNVNYVSTSVFHAYYDGVGLYFWVVPCTNDPAGFSYSYEPSSPSFPLYIDVVDSGNNYLISVSGFDDTQLAGSAYTIGVSTWSGGYKLKLTNFPMYLDGSPVHIWTSDQTFTLPVYLSDGVTAIDYYSILSFPADPTHQTFPFWWNLTTSGSITPPFDTTNPTIVPTPTPLNITGWYQDQGFESNSITAPIYDGLRGFFTSTLIPFCDFFLMPIGSLGTMISDSADTSKDAIYDSVDQLSSYAVPFNMVGAYVVRLVPEVVWLVVFAALSIGYAVLLIRISTGSIRDTINRFLGGR